MDAATKLQLREALVTEQGHLCAYCMQRIEPSERGMKIEHWSPQSLRPDLALEYTNLLGVCLGGEGLPGERQHCDTHKGNDTIWSKPCEAPRVPPIRYLADGALHGEREEVTRDIKTLNLNEAQRLIYGRSSALKALERDKAAHRGGGGEWSPARLERVFAAYVKPDDEGRLPAFAGMFEYLLEKRRARARAR